MNEQPDTRYPRIAPTQQAYPTGTVPRTSVGIPPPPPALPRKRTPWPLMAVLIILAFGLVGGTALLSYHLGRAASLARDTTQAQQLPTAQAVIAAIMRQPRNDVLGSGVRYGESISNWYFGSYPDIVSSLSSATWSYQPSYPHGPCCAPEGVFVYATTAQAMREYTAVERVSVSFEEGTPIPNSPLNDTGPVVWTLDGYCLVGNISTTDALALPAICG